MRIVCQQTILMKCHSLFVIFEKSGKIWNCRLLQIIGGALSVNSSVLYWHTGQNTGNAPVISTSMKK